VSHISSCGLVDKAKRAYREQRKRDPSMPPLVPATGEIKPGVGGSIFGILTTVGGDVAVKKFTPRTGWRQRAATPAEIKKLGLADVDAKPIQTLEDELRRATDVFVAAAAALERRVYDTRDGVGEVAAFQRALDHVAADKGNGVGVHKGNGAGDGFDLPHTQIAAE